VPPFLLRLSSVTVLRAVMSPALVVSSFAIFAFTASPLLPFVAFLVSFVPYHLHLCPAPLSPFGPSACPEPRKAKLDRARPRGPRCSPALLAPPLLLPSLLSPVPLFPLLLSSFSFLCAIVLPVYLSSPFSPFSPLLPLRCCRSSLSLCRLLLVASTCVLLH
jgi:hypothetical protein